MTQKPLTINEIVHLYYFDENVQAIIDKEAQGMKRLKHRPNYIVTYAEPQYSLANFQAVAYRWKITRATLVYRADKKRLGKSSKTVCIEKTYERASRIEDCLNAIAFAWFNHHEEYKP